MALLAFLTCPSLSAADPPWKAGAYHLARGDVDRAIRSLSGVIREGRSTAAELNLRGVAELMSGDARKAVATFDSVLKSDASFIEARFNRGIALMQLRDFAGAGAELERVHASSRELKAAAAFHRALVADAAGKQDDSIRWLEQTLAADPSFADAHLYLGAIRERRGEYRSAGESYKKYLAANPDSLVAMLRFGVVAQASGYPETAAKYLRRVVEAAPASAEGVEAAKFLVMWE